MSSDAPSPTLAASGQRTTHTPGPWSLRGEYSQDHGQFCIDGSDGVELAAVAAWVLEWRNEANANARLIAAAPDLLEALRAFLILHDNAKRSLKNANNTFVDTRDFEAFCADARAAIAKAEGTTRDGSSPPPNGTER